jgi:ATP-dependent RNA helicase DDX24/MAK5
LAYGIPILHYLLSLPPPRPNKRRPVRALILAPTRELALQVSSHLNECLNLPEPDTSANQDGNLSNEDQSDDRPTKNQKGKGKKVAPSLSVKKRPPQVSVAAIVGGMSSQKQRRIIDRGVDILVATPGRLWDIMGEVYFVLQMVHDFSVLTGLLKDDKLAREMRNLRFLVLDEADRMIETGHFAELENIIRLTLRENE